MPIHNLRRLTASACVAVLLVPAVAVGSAAADVSFGAPTGVCQMNDSRLPEGSGLLVTDTGFDAINDGGLQIEVFHLDHLCQITGTTTAQVDPYDVEDLARGSDGRLWMADIGDNNSRRANIAVEILPATGDDVTSQTLIRRFAYPDGPHDAEALIVAPDNTIVVVTKDFLGSSEVYQSPAAVDLAVGGSSDPVTLVKVGSLQLAVTDTPGGPVGLAGNLLITGAASTPDGKLIALRTYTDAYLWQVDGSSSIADTIVDSRPARVALPDAPQGEAIAFGKDSSLHLFGEGVPSSIFRIPVTVTAPAAPTTNPPTTTVPSSTSAATSTRTSATPSPDSRVGQLAIGAGAALALVVLGLVVIRAPRRHD